MFTPPDISFPEWLENFRAPDELCGAAYEGTPPSCRAAIKTAIALAFSRFDRIAASKRLVCRFSDEGHALDCLEYPAPWALVIFPASYAAAARLCAAALLPIMANAPRIACVCVNGNPANEALAALELCGASDIFCLSADKTGDLLLSMSRFASVGGVILLHNGELSALAGLAREQQMPVYEENRAPALLLAEPRFFDLQVLRFCHGFLPPASLPQTPEAIFTDLPREEPASGVRLVLTPGCEGYWSFPRISPDFFKISQTSFSLL